MVVGLLVGDGHWQSCHVPSSGRNTSTHGHVAQSADSSHTAPFGRGSTHSPKEHTVPFGQLLLRTQADTEAMMIPCTIPLSRKPFPLGDVAKVVAPIALRKTIAQRTAITL